MKALVTGGAGFIGSHIVRTLLNENYEVRVLHLPQEKLTNLEGLDVELLAGDITDPTKMDQAVAGCDLVFHTAAIYALWLPQPELMRKVNVDGTRIVLNAAKKAGIKRVVYTSTGACFAGQPKGIQATEQSPFALGATGDAYVLTKFEAHQIALQFAAGGLDVVIVCPTGPIGPQDIAPIPTGKLLLTIAQMPALAVPAAINNMIDVRDVAKGHVLAAQKGIAGETYILGNKDLDGLSLAKTVHHLLGIWRPVMTIPNLVEGISSQLAGHAALWITEHITHQAPLVTPAAAKIGQLGTSFNCTKAIKELGLPQTPVEIAVRDSLQWFAAHGYIQSRSLIKKIEAISI
ncbi:hopanoid-associated sugar epimerase [Acinetobacter sp. CIP 64.2]|uniref:NAD-dependent epimerase/dehydratase family protein n=1 Tax=Acinetobacter sp. CIP 64.2 TaxID=1217694 RepID=UPI00028A17B2|nr:NAD-dependent epimerase/dehydratase family protein [Acinetobacter sp. CIP 64.2]ENX17464.1 hopanoid-associated sugar epimerase [Acinetobacter sp. CIP 64.2]